jgi:hypothetical protein
MMMATSAVNVHQNPMMKKFSTIMWNHLFLKDQKQQHFMTLVESCTYGLEKPAGKWIKIFNPYDLK